MKKGYIFSKVSQRFWIWDASKTLKENSEILNISYINCYAMVRRYGMKYKKGIRNRTVKPLYKERKSL